MYFPFPYESLAMRLTMCSGIQPAESCDIFNYGALYDNTVDKNLQHVGYQDRAQNVKV